MRRSANIVNLLVKGKIYWALKACSSALKFVWVSVLKELNQVSASSVKSNLNKEQQAVSLMSARSRYPLSFCHQLAALCGFLPLNGSGLKEVAAGLIDLPLYCGGAEKGT
jgi:hypothetical protein